MDKDQKFEAVAHAIAELLLTNGLDALTPSQVARTAKVSRAWLYKYLGAGKLLIEFAVDRIGKDFAEFELPFSINSKTDFYESICAGSERMFTHAIKNPFLLPIYYRYVNSDSPLGEKVREIESEYLKRLSQAITKATKISPQRSKLIAEFLTSLRLGQAYQHLQKTPLRSPWENENFKKEFQKIVWKLLED